MDLDARRRRHDRLEPVLAQLSDGELSTLLAGSAHAGASIGGITRRLWIDGVPVFAKGIRLTDLEAAATTRGSTANVFGLPVMCHYGIGSPGFGVWRELAAHLHTTDLVLTDAASMFPLMYHWRILPAEPTPLADELGDLEAAVRFWDGSRAVRARITALSAASQLVWVFMEFHEATLDAWLAEQVRSGPAALAAACDLVEAELRRGAAALAAAGLLHFDLHFQNVLTDGSRLYFADLGLVVSDRFDLDPAEQAFAAEHRDYDRSYSFVHLVNWLQRNVEPIDLPPRAADLIRRYRPIAEVMMPFYLELQNRSRHSRYPRAGEQRAWTSIAAEVR